MIQRAQNEIENVENEVSLLNTVWRQNCHEDGCLAFQLDLIYVNIKKFIRIIVSIIF